VNSGTDRRHGFWRDSLVVRYGFAGIGAWERRTGFQDLNPAMQPDEFSGDCKEGNGHNDQQCSFEINQADWGFGLSDVLDG
jgi:hypothetical protein